MSFLKLISSIFIKNKEIANQKEMSYDEMLERAYIKLAIKKMGRRTIKCCYVKMRSAELISEINNEIAEELKI